MEIDVDEAILRLLAVCSTLSEVWPFYLREWADEGEPDGDIRPGIYNMSADLLFPLYVNPVMTGGYAPNPDFFGAVESLILHGSTHVQDFVGVDILPRLHYLDPGWRQLRGLFGPATLELVNLTSEGS